MTYGKQNEKERRIARFRYNGGESRYLPEAYLSAGDEMIAFLLPIDDCDPIDLDCDEWFPEFPGVGRPRTFVFRDDSGKRLGRLTVTPLAPWDVTVGLNDQLDNRGFTCVPDDGGEK